MPDKEPDFQLSGSFIVKLLVSMLLFTLSSAYWTIVGSLAIVRWSVDTAAQTGPLWDYLWTPWSAISAVTASALAALLYFDVLHSIEETDDGSDT